MSLVSDRNLPFFLAAAAFAASLQFARDNVIDDTDEQPQQKTTSAMSSIDQPPVDAADAELRVEVEREDEKFSWEEQGYRPAVGGVRPALIIVMVSHHEQTVGSLALLTKCMFCFSRTGTRIMVSDLDFFRLFYNVRLTTILSCTSGKSTIGMSMAEAFNVPFIDGDSLHPKSNVDKMSAGHPLNDSDRLPWLALIRATAERVCREEWITRQHGMFGVTEDEDGNLNREVKDVAGMADWEFGEGWKWKKSLDKTPDEGLGIPKRGLGRPAVIIACSALKSWYRDILRGKVPVELSENDISGAKTDKVSQMVFVQLQRGSVI